jgi:hypothetical protein
MTRSFVSYCPLDQWSGIAAFLGGDGADASDPPRPSLADRLTGVTERGVEITPVLPTR